MLFFALICVLICAALIALAALWQRARPVAPELAHEKALYAGFVADVERRLTQGEIDAEQAQEERTQAARALLKAGETVSETAPVKPLHGYLALGAIAVLSAWIYIFTGHPDLGDRPYAARLATWTYMAKTDPDSLPPQAMAAVLRQGAVQNAENVEYWLLLGRTDMLAGNSYDGAQDYQKALALSPQTFTAWSELGEALTFVGGGVTGPDARAAFDKALALNPKDARTHFYLGQQALADGEYAVSRAHFTAALDAMAPNDPSRPQVEQALATVAPAEAAAKEMNERISGMVTSLAAQLAADPENPEGWARLLRSYEVLGDKPARAKAQADMQKHYANRPEIIADILTKAQTRVGSEGESK